MLFRRAHSIRLKSTAPISRKRVCRIPLFGECFCFYGMRGRWTATRCAIFGLKPASITIDCLRDLRPANPAQPPVRTELARRHAEAFPELLPEVVLGIKAAAAGDLGNAQISAFEEAGCLFQPFFLEEVTEEASGDAVKAA